MASRILKDNFWGLDLGLGLEGLALALASMVAALALKVQALALEFWPWLHHWNEPFG